MKNAVKLCGVREDAAAAIAANRVILPASLP